MSGVSTLGVRPDKTERGQRLYRTRMIFDDSNAPRPCSACGVMLLSALNTASKSCVTLCASGEDARPAMELFGQGGCAVMRTCAVAVQGDAGLVETF